MSTQELVEKGSSLHTKALRCCGSLKDGIDQLENSIKEQKEALSKSEATFAQIQAIQSKLIQECKTLSELLFSTAADGGQENSTHVAQQIGTVETLISEGKALLCMTNEVNAQVSSGDEIANNSACIDQANLVLVKSKVKTTKEATKNILLTPVRLPGRKL